MRHLTKYLLLGVVCVGLAVPVFAQDDLQGFDRNYPNTPAGDNPRGFTPEINPLTKPPLVSPQLSVDEAGSQNNQPDGKDSLNQPQPFDNPIPGVE